MVVRTALFCFVDVATQVGLVRTVFFLWAMQHRWTCSLMSVRQTWPRTPFLRSSHLTALFWCAKNELLPLFKRRDVALRKIRHVRDETASKTSSCLERAIRHYLRHVLAARAYERCISSRFLAKMARKYVRKAEER